MSSEICMLTNIQKGCVSDPNFDGVVKGGREGRRGERRREEGRLLRNELFSMDFFFLFIGFGGLCCFVLLEGLSKGSHHVLITRYMF